MRRIDACATLLRFLRIVRRIGKPFMQGVGHVHETAEVMPIALAEIGHTTEKEGCDDDGISHGGPHNYAVFCEAV